MAILNSNSSLVWLDTIPIPDVTSTSLSVANSIVEATLSDTGRFLQYVSGVNTGSISIECLGLPSTSFEIGQVVLLRIGNDNYSYASDAILKDISVNGDSDAVVGYSLTLEVTGILARFIPIFGLDKLVTDTGDQVVTDTGDNICVLVQQN